MASQHRLLRLAGPAGKRVGVTHRRIEPVGDLAEQQVAGTVSQGVVDLLEMVEIHEQQRHQFPGAARIGDGLLDPLLEQHPVGQ